MSVLDLVRDDAIGPRVTVVELPLHATMSFILGPAAKPTTYPVILILAVTTLFQDYSDESEGDIFNGKKYRQVRDQHFRIS